MKGINYNKKGFCFFNFVAIFLSQTSHFSSKKQCLQINIVMGRWEEKEGRGKREEGRGRREKRGGRWKEEGGRKKEGEERRG